MSPVDTNKGWNGVQDMNYPAPLASHEDVANDPIVFWDTLRRFHFLMNTKFMIPVIGGKELDLHILYVEVTRRGGFEKVVAEKKWREVGTIFMFSPTTTSASFVLRKHYISLLYHYEQVHFFNMQGSLCSPSVTFPVCTRPCKSELAIVQYSPKPMNDFPLNQDIEGIGTIDGKFDCGYLVTVKLGSEVLTGVLYHPEEEGSASPVADPNNAIVPYTGKPRHSRRRRKSKRRGDPNYPKPNRSGYNFFFAEKHYKLKSLYPNREREFTKMIGESWTNLSPEERTVYQNIGLKDKERYRRELKEYKESMKLRQQTMEENI
ncbi:high mobility group B protein 9 [Humulus lupulus]|uniref:high mobility group B protein 9 n=1 Tax=Humulus lupulus TaxID=3486 RepID=UPI002B415E53|nr:high mobility group B protein 9 [Humulus lupulus]